MVANYVMSFLRAFPESFVRSSLQKGLQQMSTSSSTSSTTATRAQSLRLDGISTSAREFQAAFGDRRQSTGGGGGEGGGGGGGVVIESGSSSTKCLNALRLNVKEISSVAGLKLDASNNNSIALLRV